MENKPLDKLKVIRCKVTKGGTLILFISSGGDKPDRMPITSPEMASNVLKCGRFELNTVEKALLEGVSNSKSYLAASGESKSRNKNKRKSKKQKDKKAFSKPAVTPSGASKTGIPNGVAIDLDKGSTTVTIIIDNKRRFHDFDEAIEFLENSPVPRESILGFLRKERDKWYRDIWIPRLIRIISHYDKNRIPFIELFSRMNDYYHKEFSEEEALQILSLCRNVVIRIEEKGEDGNKLATGIYFSLKETKPLEKPEPKRPTLPQPQVNDANDDIFGFESDYRRLIDYDFNTIQKDIFVGLDFGTSFTKAAYHYTPGDRGIFLFGNSPFKPTVVYYNETDKILSFFRRSPDDRQIQFFKATMVKDRDQYSELRYNNVLLPSPEVQRDFELLCSVFFISNILLFIRHKLNEVFPFDANLNVAMGIPLFGYNTQTIYNKALHAGLYIANKVTDPSLLPIERVYELYNESMTVFEEAFYTGFPHRFQHCTIPELFTESLYLLNKRTYAPGYYYIVDIGGGTADFAFIHKDINYSESQFDYFCPSAVVAKLGNEVRKACSTSDQYANAYRNEFGLKYRTTIAKGKFGLDLHGHMEITQLLFGGGAVDPSNYYQKNKSVFTSGLHSISCHVSSRTDAFDDNPFIPQNLNLSQEDKQRLIIATQLANPETSDSFLKAGPEQYDHNPKPERKTADISELYPRQYDNIN